MTAAMRGPLRKPRSEVSAACCRACFVTALMQLGSLSPRRNPDPNPDRKLTLTPILILTLVLTLSPTMNP